jgi:hypothetical protein
MQVMVRDRDRVRVRYRDRVRVSLWFGALLLLFTQSISHCTVILDAPPIVVASHFLFVHASVILHSSVLVWSPSQSVSNKSAARTVMGGWAAVGRGPTISDFLVG